MAAPVYSNSGSLFAATSDTSRSPSLPASLVIGNVLIAVCGTKNADTHSCATSGWQAWQQFQYSTTLHVSIWYYEVNGSETAPTITWANTAACVARIFQFTRAVRYTGGTIGGTYSNNSGNTSTHSTSSFNTTANNSLAVYIDVANANTDLGIPATWSERIDSGNAGPDMRLSMGDKSIATAGSATGAISVTGANAPWIQIQLELLEPGTATYLLDAQGGSYALTGGDAGLVLGYNMTADGGSYALTGGDADLLYKQFKFLGSARQFSSPSRNRSFRSGGR